MTEVAVTEALVESVSPSRVHVSHLSCQVVLPLSGRTERPGHWCTDIGQGVPRDPGTKLPAEDESKPRPTAGELSEAFNREWLVAVSQAALGDDEDAASLPTPGKLL
jgi:hypothetical protein